MINLIMTRDDGSYMQSRTTDHYNKVVRSEIGWKKFDFHSLRHTHATEQMEPDSIDLMNRIHGGSSDKDRPKPVRPTR